jgi:hypothetical protein
MVTRHLEPAAFAVNLKVPFCVLDDVVKVVDQDPLPDPGLHSLIATPREAEHSDPCTR